MFQIVRLVLDDNGEVDARRPLQPLFELREDAMAMAEFDASRLSGDYGCRSEEHTSELQSRPHLVCRLLLHQLRERRTVFPFAAQRVRQQLPQVLAGERRKRDLAYLSTRALDRREFQHQRMSSVDLVVAISTDQQQVP